jgi:SAM-dependent methyltransferase
LPADARILDVGCGDGFHLKLLQKFGNKSWTLEGIDIDKKATAKAKESGLNVYEGTVENANLPAGSYDLIIMIMTIEHVERPDNVLKSAYQLLKKGGRVVLVTDNTGSFDFRFFKNSHWGGYHFPRHWNLFNHRSLLQLATAQGFVENEIKTIISPVNWVYSIHNKLVDKGYPKWLSNCFTLKSTISLTVFTAFDFILQLFGRGALLQATLKK